MKDKVLELALFGLGCFWGAERRFWETKGVITTAVGYAGGKTSNPTYDEVCTGNTDHNEVVLIEFDPAIISYKNLLSIFWNSHNPTQGMRQGNDCGSQYRSSIFTFNDEQTTAAKASFIEYQAALDKAGFSTITTEVLPAPIFYYAEDYHQQYLLKNPNGYCGLGGLKINQE